MKTRWQVSVALCVLPLVSSAQIAISSGVQKYPSLTNTTVNLSGKCELWVTSSSTPLSGCAINLNSVDSYLVLPGIKPSVAAGSACMSQVRINGAAAAVDSNCRVVEYASGAIVLPHASSLQPLQVFSGPSFTGSSMALGQWTYYKSSLGAMYANISSFKLKRGYMATFAQNESGTGISRNCVAQDGDMEVSLLPSNLDKKIRFVYVTPWRWTAKKATAGWPGNSIMGSVQSWYNWNIDSSSSRDLEYVAIRQKQYWPGLGQNWKSRGVNTLLGYNEPDHTDQANMSVSTAIGSWPDLLGTGLRLGSPATSDGGYSWWLYPFMSQADASNLRVDFVAVHYYRCYDPSNPSGAANQLYNALKGIYDQTKRPIWVTEWNNGANWTGCGDPTYAQQQACVAAMINMMDNTPWIERYNIYNWVEAVRAVVDGSGNLTLAGQTYAAQKSPVGYVQALQSNGTRSWTQLAFENNTLDSSGYGNNGIAAGSPAYTNGVRGQAIVFDGANTVVALPPNIATSAGFTFAAWVKWDGGANWQRIFDFGNSTTHYLFLSPNTGSAMRFAIANGGSEQRLDAAALPQNQWTHLAVTLDGSTGKLYTNGVLAAQNTGMSIRPTDFDPRYNYIGKSQFTGDPRFKGLMDEVFIADFAESPGGVALLMTKAPPAFTNSIIERGAATEASAYNNTLAGAAADPEGYALNFTKVTGPAWLNIASDGTMTGTPTAADGGTNYFTVIASDLNGGGPGLKGYAVVTIFVRTVTTSGTWISNADGIWGDTNNWSAQLIATGTNQTADFSTLNITADRIVTLDSSRTIGLLKFGDLSGGQNWTLAASNGAVLKLDTASTLSPSVSVYQNTATLAAPISGTNGFTKTGSGTLILSGDNSLSGTINIDSGTAANDGITRLAGPDSLGNATLINIRNNNNGQSTLQLDGSEGDIIVNADVIATCRNNGVTTIGNLAGTSVFNGNIWLQSGGDSYTVEAGAGSQFVFTGTQQYIGGLTGARTLYFTGAGDHHLVGPVLNSTNGAPIALWKSGAGTLRMEAENTYGNGTTLAGGMLLVNGTLPAGTFAISSGVRVGGNGVILPALTLPSGATLMPGDNFGTLTVKNDATLNAGCQTVMAIKPQEILPDGISPLTNAQLRVTGTLTFGGILIVTNLSGSLSAGDSFHLFDAAGITGSFSTFSLPALDPGLLWSSNPVTGVLTVATTNNTPPTISSVSDQTINEDTPTIALALTVGDAEAPASSLVLSAVSSNPNLVLANNFVFGGSGSNRTVTITPATNQYGSATIMLNVSDGSLNTITSFQLAVNPINDPPTISAIPNQTWNKNVVIGPIAFIVGDPDTPAGSLTVSAASSNPSLIPLSGIVLGGSGTSRTVTLTPAANQGGISMLTLTVSDGTLTANSSFLVSIKAPLPIGKANNTVNLNWGSSWVGGLVPDTNGIAVWDSTVTSANSVALGANANWNGLTISNPAGPVTITAGNTLTLGESGINMSAASQDLTISSGVALDVGNQSWNVANGGTLTLNSGTFTRTRGATVNLPGTGTVAASMTGMTNNTSLPSPGIVGPWLTIGTGSSTRYASISGGNLVPYTGLATVFNWSTTLPNNTNIEVSATSSAIGVDRMCNTLRWTGGTATQAYGSGSSANRLILDGLMNAGSGPLTFSLNSGTPRLVIGTNNPNNELTIQAASAGITINLPIVDSTAGTGSVTVVGPNTVTFAGANTYTGGTCVNSGTLKLGVANTIPSTSSVAANGTLDMASYSDTIAGLSGTGIIDNSVAGTPTLTVSGAASTTFSGTIKNTAGTLALTKSGAGTLTLASANVYSGNTTIGTGGGASVIRAAANQALGTGTIAFDSTGNASTARLELTGSINLPNTISLSGRNNATVAIENIAGSNTISGQIGLVAGGGTYNIQSDSGSLAIGTAGSTGISISASGTRNVTLQGAGDGSVPGNIVDGGGTLSITMAGSGTWALNGANTYSGGTTINTGTLLVNGSLGPGNVTVNGGTLGGNGVIGGPVTIQPGSTLTPGTSIGQLTINNELTLAGTTLMEISKSPLANDQLRAAGTLTYGGTLTVTNLAGTLAAGDSFQLFNAFITSGSFAVINLPSLDPGLMWDTSNLASGVISVVATPRPQFSAMNQTGDGNFHFTGTGAAGATYDLEAAATLVTPIPWVFVTSTVADQNGMFQLWDVSATNFPQRFYRITSPQ